MRPRTESPLRLVADTPDTPGAPVPAGSQTALPRLRQDRDPATGITHITFPQQKVDGTAIRELYEVAATLSDERAPKLLVDLTGVPQTSTGVLGILVAIHKRFLHVGGQLHLAVPDSRVRQQFELTRLDLLLKLFTDPATARAKFKL